MDPPQRPPPLFLARKPGSADAAVIPSGIGGFIACKALSKRNDAPAAASRPWDRNRDGFVMGEGAGVLVLEELSHALARGARIYGERRKNAKAGASRPGLHLSM